MKPSSLPAEGGCRCGHVRLRIAAAPLLTMACHCTGCQRMSGSAYSLSAAIPSESFAVIQGEAVRGGASDGAAGHHFCPRCWSWMFTRPQGLDWFVNLRPTMLDDAAWFSPFIETYTSEALPWARTPVVHSFAQFPPFEAYEALIGVYAVAAA